MTDDFVSLSCDLLGLMNRAFADPASPESVAREFYHQFRKMWDRGIPVGMGLGHLVCRPESGYDLAIHQLGERGTADRPFAAIRVGEVPPPAPRYAVTLAIVFARPAGVAAGVTVVVFDPAAWAAAVLR